MYALTVAVLALGAGVCTLIPRTRRLIGPGLLLGLVAASTWGLLFLITDRMRDREMDRGRLVAGAPRAFGPGARGLPLLARDGPLLLAFASSAELPAVSLGG